MFEGQVPGGPRTYCDLWIEKFAVTCDIICRLVVMPTMLVNDVSFSYGFSSGNRETAANLKSHRILANDMIAGLYQSLGHDNEARWGNKDERPLIRKTARLGKRKREDKDGLTAGGDGVFGRGGPPRGAVQD